MCAVSSIASPLSLVSRLSSSDEMIDTPILTNQKEPLLVGNVTFQAHMLNDGNLDISLNYSHEILYHSTNVGRGSNGLPPSGICLHWMQNILPQKSLPPSISDYH